MNGDARHRAAVAETLSSARAAAARGDYIDALDWLAMLDAIGHRLSPEDEALREQWQGILVNGTATGGACGAGAPTAGR